MNLTAYWRLAWKEYRAVRAFWIAIVVLIGLLQLFALFNGLNPTSAAASMYTLAVGAPAFFALGCAGAAFAMEKEEGTYEFLQASPVSSRQVLAGKLSVAVAATAVLFVTLWLLAAAISRQGVPSQVPLADLMGLWFVAALEAIAWGTLFSLCLARPLVAICLALVATTTTTHLLAASVKPVGIYVWQLEPYLTAIPRRLTLAAVVLAVDVILGLRWLHARERPKRRTEGKSSDRPLMGLIPIPAVVKTTAADDLIDKPDRSAVLGHLLWQHVRQSGRMMLLMSGLLVAVSLLAEFTAVDNSRDESSALVAMTVMTALSGACVFLADQEKRRVRFFVEHNVPPRFVWLTRQVPWMTSLALATVIVMVIKIDFWYLLRVAVAPRSQLQYFDRWRPGYDILLSFLGLACAVVAYAAGQWASMTLRSGLIAGFVGVVLAGALSFWAFLIFLMQESWLLFVAPIPLVLLWATWFKAPDWIRENSSLRARVKAAAAVAAPAVALVAMLAVHRVTSITPIDPGFNVATYLAEITPAARQTTALYRRASDLYVAPALWENYDRESHLAENSEALALLLEASRRPGCVLDDPRTATDDAPLPHGMSLLQLLLESARQLQDEGKLDEALDRYFVVPRVVSHWLDHAPLLTGDGEVYLYMNTHALKSLGDWAAAKGQTPERIKDAIARVEALNEGILHLEDGPKSNYVLMREFLLGKQSTRDSFNENGTPTAGQLMWLRMMPWEKYRELRLLNRMTDRELMHFSDLRDQFRRGDAMAGRVSDQARGGSRFPVGPLGDGWLEFVLGRASDRALTELVWFEEHRRAALVILALEAYRLENGQLPDTLDELVGPYLDKLPLDPYSARPFVYYPRGIPEPTTPLEKLQFEEFMTRSGEVFTPPPGIWSTGPNLVSGGWRKTGWDPDGDAAAQNPAAPVYYHSLDAGNRDALPTYVALGEGHWYPIPQQEE